MHAVAAEAVALAAVAADAKNEEPRSRVILTEPIAFGALGKGTFTDCRAVDALTKAGEVNRCEERTFMFK